jgi:hypothetical protein
MDSLAMRNTRGWRNAALTANEPIPAERWMEHRWGWRRPCRARVCVAAGGGVAGVGGLRDVSMSGAFIETALALPLFAQIAVAVLRHDGTRCGEYTATVVRRSVNGVGIEWTDPVAGSVCNALGCAGGCPFADVPA